MGAMRPRKKEESKGKQTWWRGNVTTPVARSVQQSGAPLNIVHEPS
jgi:hypothetical protein